MIFEDDTACLRLSAPPEPPLAPPPPIQVPPVSFYFEYPTRSVPTTIPIIIPSAMNNNDNNINMASNDQIYNMTSAAAASTVNNLPSGHSPGPWSSGLCDCCHDIHTCCLTCCCPCVAFGRIAEIVD